LTFNIAEIQPVSYGTYQYPDWAISIGWIIGLSYLVPIVIYMVIALWKEEGNLLQVGQNSYLCKYKAKQMHVFIVCLQMYCRYRSGYQEGGSH